MSSYRYSRRALLQSVGLGAAFLPLLNASKGSAAPAMPRRLIIMSWTNGVIEHAWWPTGGETTFNFNDCMKSLEPFKKDVVVLGPVGIRSDYDAWKMYNYEAGGHHTWPSLLTGGWPVVGHSSDGAIGVANTASVDQYIAKAYQAKDATKFPSMVLGAINRFGNDDERTISYRGPAVGPKPSEALPELNPYTVWMNMFKDVPSLPNSGMAGVDKAFLDKVKGERRSILDYVDGQIAKLQARLGKDDADKLGAHLDSMRQLELELLNLDSATASATCTPMQPADGVPWNQGVQNNKVLPVQMDLILMALRCNLTRVATFMMGTPANDGWFYPFLGSEFPSTGKYLDGDHHGIAHGGGDPDGKKKIAIDTYFVQQFAYMVNKLKSTPEGTGTMLDNSLVVLCNHMGNGAAHNGADGVPFIMAGSCQGYIKTGRWLARHKRDAPHNGILVGIANAMLNGIEAPLTYFGDPVYGPRYGGELPGFRG